MSKWHVLPCGSRGNYCSDQRCCRYGRRPAVAGCHERLEQTRPHPVRHAWAVVGDRQLRRSPCSEAVLQRVRIRLSRARTGRRCESIAPTPAHIVDPFRTDLRRRYTLSSEVRSADSLSSSAVGRGAISALELELEKHRAALERLADVWTTLRAECIDHWGPGSASSARRRPSPSGLARR